MSLKIEDSGFGWVVINGLRYDHDLVITADGKIIPRPKHLSKKYGGSKTLLFLAGSKISRFLARWHTVLGPEEIESALIGNPDILLAGCGQFSQLPILDETRTLLAQRGVQIESGKTQNTLARYAELENQGKRIAAILHVTC